MECPKYLYFRLKSNRHGTVIEIEDASDADVVEVVRCKDCKYRDDDDFCTGRGYPNVLVSDDGFCDKGKRSLHRGAE